MEASQQSRWDSSRKRTTTSTGTTLAAALSPYPTPRRIRNPERETCSGGRMIRRVWKPAPRRRFTPRTKTTTSTSTPRPRTRKFFSCSCTTTATTTLRRNPGTSTQIRWIAARSGSSTTILTALPHSTKDSYASSCQRVCHVNALDSRSMIWSTFTSCSNRSFSESSTKARLP
eukprot:1259533-Pleurochrysis_carterae.AAC.1